MVGHHGRVYEAFTVRTASEADRRQILGVIRGAFSDSTGHGREEVEIAEATWWRRAVPRHLELVAVDGPTIVGHVLTGWGALDGRRVVGIAPLAVRPDRQGLGIGSALMAELLRRAGRAELPLVVLLGHPAYYGRFGFEPAGPLGISYAPAGAGNPGFQVRRLAGYDPSFRGEFTYCWESAPSEPDHTLSNRSTYDRIARRYARHQDGLPSGDAHWLLELESSFVSGLPPEALVADLGCGPADDGARLTGKGCRVVGMDISSGMLRIAAERLDHRVAQADLRAVPVGSGVLDGVWNVASLLHVPDRHTQRVLREFSRILQPSGSLVLVTATATGPTTFHEPVGYAPEENRWFVYRDRTTLGRQLRLAGFTIVAETLLGGSREWWAVLARSGP